MHGQSDVEQRPIKAVGTKELPLILVVEDEWFLQADLLDALGNSGFEADAVFSGEEALKLFESGMRPYKVLITDIRLAGSMTGWGVAKQIREKDSTFPVIYLTGSSVEEWSSNRVPNGILIPKPFVSAELISSISNLLRTDVERPSITRTSGVGVTV